MWIFAGLTVNWGSFVFFWAKQPFETWDLANFDEHFCCFLTFCTTDNESNPQAKICSEQDRWVIGLFVLSGGQTVSKWPQTYFLVLQQRSLNRPLRTTSFQSGAGRGSVGCQCVCWVCLCLCVGGTEGGRCVSQSAFGGAARIGASV